MAGAGPTTDGSFDFGFDEAVLRAIREKQGVGEVRTLRWLRNEWVKESTDGRTMRASARPLKEERRR